MIYHDISTGNPRWPVFSGAPTGTAAFSEQYWDSWHNLHPNSDYDVPIIGRSNRDHPSLKQSQGYPKRLPCNYIIGAAFRRMMCQTTGGDEVSHMSVSEHGV